jgi:glycosyltransferase involved in cell wall biosynthesis
MEQASLRLMSALKVRGHDISLLSLNPIGKMRPLLEAVGIPCQGLAYGGPYGCKAIPGLRRYLANSDADAVLMTGHHLLAMMALGRFCRGRRILAIHFHHEGVKNSWVWRLIYMVACTKFQAVTFPADFIRKEAEGIYPPVASRAHTVRYPIALPTLRTPESKRAARCSLGLPLYTPIVGNAGWLIPRKRFDVFLRTAAIIAKSCPDVHFLIAGDGEERPRLESLAARLGLASRIKWTSWVEDMRTFYESIDVLLFNSDWDALPMTPQESMSYGIPVVASVIHGGLKEVLANDEWGKLLDRHDEEALAAAVSRLISNPSEANAVGSAGRERIGSISAPENIAAYHEKLLLGQ